MYSGRDSNTPIVDVVVTPATAIAGVTPIVTSRPASTLKPTKPTKAPTAETGLVREADVFWADIGCSLNDTAD
nr:hypothetical protein GCM10017610_15100 [Curtobacterium pusillum]